MLTTQDLSILLLVYASLGFVGAIANEATDISKRKASNEKRDAWDILYPFFFLLSVGYGLFAVKYLWHQRVLFVGLVGILSVLAGLALGNQYREDHGEKAMRIIIVVAMLGIPVVFWRVLP